MKNHELIEILSKQNPNDEVFISYDSMCCIYRNFSIVKAEANPKTRNLSGIYLMAQNGKPNQYFESQCNISTGWKGPKYPRPEPIMVDDYLNYEVLKEYVE